MGLPLQIFLQHLVRESEVLAKMGQGRKALERVIADGALVERVRDQFFQGEQRRALAGVLAMLDLTDRGHRATVFELLQAHRSEVLQLVRAATGGGDSAAATG